jgi:hypothetical protein
VESVLNPQALRLVQGVAFGGFPVGRIPRVRGRATPLTCISQHQGVHGPQILDAAGGIACQGGPAIGAGAQEGDSGRRNPMKHDALNFHSDGGAFQRRGIGKIVSAVLANSWSISEPAKRSTACGQN